LTIHNQHVGNNNVTDEGEAVGKSEIFQGEGEKLARGFKESERE